MAPLAGCRAPTEGRVLVRSNGRLKWKWKNGDQTTATSTAPSIRAAGKGFNPPIPALPVTFPTTVQWHASDGFVQECWQSTFSAAPRDDARKLEAKAP